MMKISNQRIAEFPPRPMARFEHFGFLTVFLLEFLQMAYHIFSRRIVGGHDGIHHVALQYYFQNSVQTTGEIPQWIPFITHGSVANWFYLLQANILQNVLFFTAPLLKGLNFLPIYHLGIFFDKCLLLTGVWLLTSRYFTSILTRCFVTLCVMGTVVWMYAPWFNFYFYYAVPLILFLFHQFLETKRWRYFFLAGNLIAFQNMGNLLYLLPVSTMIIFFYFVFHSLFHWPEVRQQLSVLRWKSLEFAASLCGIVLSFSAVFIIKSWGTDLISLYRIDRNLDGQVSLDTFLNYGVILDPGIWLELILGISWNFDNALYLGLGTLPFIFYGLLLTTPRRSLPLVCLIVWIILFSRGTFISTFLYYTWPMMKFYRHLSNVAIFVKVFLCFLAGFGFEAVFCKPNACNRSRLFYYTLILIAGMLGGMAMLFYQAAHDTNFLNQFAHLDAFSMVSKHPFQHDALAVWLTQSALFALLSSTLMAAIFFWRTPQALRRLAFLAIILQIVNLYGYQWHLTQLRSLPLTDDQYRVLTFQTMPFPQRRVREWPAENPRVSLLKALPLRDFYGYLNCFLFVDEIESGRSYRTTDWLRPLDQLMRTYWGQNLDPHSSYPQGLKPDHTLQFPLTHPAAGKLAGLSQDKVQFFAQAYLLNNDEDVADHLRHPQYQGDIVFLSRDGKHHTDGIPLWKNGLALNANQRIPLTYSLLQFTSNRFAIEVDLPGKHPIWMVYSDVWHPFWKAYINGEHADVYRANLAYKAVQLFPGHNLVHFAYEASLLNIVQHINMWHALGWFLFTGWLIFRCGGLRFGRERF
jgi:hypothetical protein